MIEKRNNSGSRSSGPSRGFFAPKTGFSAGRSSSSSSRKTFAKKRYCFFCKEERTLGTAFSPDYKNTTLLKKFTTDRGKIIAKNRSGLCAQHQRQLALSVKRARQLALLPYSSHL